MKKILLISIFILLGITVQAQVNETEFKQYLDSVYCTKALSEIKTGLTYYVNTNVLTNSEIEIAYGDCKVGTLLMNKHIIQNVLYNVPIIIRRD